MYKYYSSNLENVKKYKYQPVSFVCFLATCRSLYFERFAETERTVISEKPGITGEAAESTTQLQFILLLQGMQFSDSNGAR